jgi:hypothetical protein
MHLSRIVLCGGLSLLGLGAHNAAAQSGLAAAAPRSTHSVGADYGQLLYLAPGLPLSAGGASVFYRFRAGPGVALSAGLRSLHVDRLPDGFGFEGFVAVQLSPIVGPWRPLAGIEVGGTSLSSERLRAEPDYGPEEYTPRLQPLGPVYAGFVIAPLRFAIRHVVFQLGGIQIATHLPQLGNALRLQILYGQLEWSF